MNNLQNTLLRLLDALKDSQDFNRIITQAGLTEGDYEALMRDTEEHNFEDYRFTDLDREEQACTVAEYIDGLDNASDSLEMTNLSLKLTDKLSE